MNADARRAALREVLAGAPLGSQVAVRAALAARGVGAHPATVGRDLEELGARKVRGADGQLAWRLPEAAATPPAPLRRLDDALRTFVTSVAASGNLLVLRTPPACASPVASALDGAGDPDILGTLAGDDTVVAVLAEGADAQALAARLRATAAAA